MTTREELRAELRRIVFTVKRHVEEQLELGFERAPTRKSPEPAPPKDVVDDSGQILLDARQPNPFAEMTLAELDAEARGCVRCALSATRTNVVFGVGNPDADLMFVGEAPGHDEDLKGEPFVGRAGQLLTKIIEAMGFSREQVYIANVLKCRPPENRDPLPAEVEQCEPFLLRQLELVRPKVVVALGRHAVKSLLRTDERITRLRGRFHEFHGIPVMPTYHPAFLLRNPDAKREVWEDMKLVMDELKRQSAS
jgi:DNA polymerase